MHIQLGGSALDAAKSIAMFANSKVENVRQFDFWLDSPAQLPQGGHFVPVITMPTTAGTGAEMGTGSMLTDLQKNEKMCVGHPNLSGQYHLFMYMINRLLKLFYALMSYISPKICVQTLFYSDGNTRP